MSRYTYRAVNLTGAHWPTKDGRHVAGFNTATPGFGVQCVETGRLLSVDAETPSTWRTQRTAAHDIAPYAEALGADRNHTWVTIIPPTKPKSWSQTRYRDFWAAPQTVRIFQHGEIALRYHNADLISAWIIARPYLTQTSNGYQVTVTPTHGV